MRRGRFSRKADEALVSAPSFLWLLVFFVIPTVVVFAIAFKPSDPYGGVGEGWTLDTLRSLGNPNYPAVVWRTLWLSVITTAVCLLMAVPSAYYIARTEDRLQRLLLLLVIIPFWTNFLIRIFAWKVLLHPEGPLKRILVMLHIASPDAQFMYRPSAVLMVLIYTYLPFAILPIFAAAEKFDFSLVEAAMDLGATRLTAFLKVFVPGISRGLVTAALVVFVPALGSYVIPDIMGGPTGDMIGNKIAQRTFIDRNLPHASALSALLTLAVLLPMLYGLLSRARRKGMVVPQQEGML